MSSSSSSSSGGGGDRKRTISDSDSENEYDNSSRSADQRRHAHQGQQYSSRRVTRSINEVLQKALNEAMNPLNEMDEEPEKLAAPGRDDVNVHGRDQELYRLAQEQEQEEREERRIALEKEEQRAKEIFDKLSEDDITTSMPLGDMKKRARYIPLRLSYEERKTLRLVNAAISVSDYTNIVDIPFKNKAKRHHAQLQSIVAFLTGVMISTDYHCKELLEDRNFVVHEEAIQRMLEIARRYKITKPEKMRSEYGKLICLMQDAVSVETKRILGINIEKTIKTVYDTLKEVGAIDMLDNPAIDIATQEILPDPGKTRSMIQVEIKKKERAIEYLLKKYSTRCSDDVLRTCLYSISDNNSFLNSNKRPISQCIALLKKYFDPVKIDTGYSLSIDEGLEGARLSHSHELQYNYVLQSLTLWENILEDMFRLWYLSEADLLSEADPYELKNTGQGLQRVQNSPQVFKSMHEILGYTQRALGKSNWIGSSVIHLGDHNVPNALTFIDKYTQVSRILGPLIKTIDNLEVANENEGLQSYIKSYGGIEKAKKDILHDFFTHAFDGSGGDNFFDAGSCIDGRLTSAWNWCSQISSKPYYPLFRLTGFLSFDGEFDK